MPWPTRASVLVWRSAWRGLGGRGSSTPRSSALRVSAPARCAWTRRPSPPWRWLRWPAFAARPMPRSTHLISAPPKAGPQTWSLTDQVVGLAHKAWADLTAGPAGKLRPTHDTYLKQWQLSEPHLGYDVILYDEAQDADACVADVVSRQSHAQLVAVGDSAQATSATVTPSTRWSCPSWRCAKGAWARRLRSGPRSRSPDAPLCINISQINEADEKLQAAVLLACWGEGFGAIAAQHALSDAGLEPKRNYFIVLDELWRVLRAGKGLVDRVDALTRLNRQAGVGMALVTHTLADLEALPDQSDQLKAMGFAERSGYIVCGGLPAKEIPRLSKVVHFSRAAKNSSSPTGPRRLLGTPSRTRRPHPQAWASSWSRWGAARYPARVRHDPGRARAARHQQALGPGLRGERFLKASTMRDLMLTEVEKVTWYPEWAGSARFYDWIKEARDWCISRQRYWGIPIPVWVCKKCDKYRVIGTIEDSKRPAERKFPILTDRS